MISVNIESSISKFGIVPVLVVNDACSAILVAKSLMDGGLPCAEITFRTDAAEESIRLISKKYPDMLVGAGTVTSIKQVERAIAAGAKFIVSPGFDLDIVDYCLNNNISIFPGCVTPSEVMQAVKRGLKILKFFPSEQFGGLDMINALCGPFPDVKFIPTGGINTMNLRDYLMSEHVLACGGTWMVKSSYINNREFDRIYKITKEAVDLVQQIRGA